MKTLSFGIIGSGFGGIAAAIELRRAGYDAITIFERAGDLGGVWRENTYPGVACDIPSPFYCFSYAPNPGWPRRFSHGPVILEYARALADKHDLRRHLRLHHAVTRADFDADRRGWVVQSAAGETTFVDVLVSAVGQLSQPAWPQIRRIDTFAGPAFHSAQWDHSVSLSGRRVAVIGTGASAIQFVPQIQPDVAKLLLFQRSAPYILPRWDREFGPAYRAAIAGVPLLQTAERLLWYATGEAMTTSFQYSPALGALLTAACRLHMRHATRDVPGLFPRIWPDYPVGCKRILFSSDYLPALTQPNVDLITDQIRAIEPRGLVTADGTQHAADVLIYGTGFRATDFLSSLEIRGLDGAKLSDAWAAGAHAYYGMTVPRFPNLVILYGPNTNTGGGSILYFLEAQARYLRALSDHIARSGRPAMVRADVEAAFDREMQDALRDSVWGACTSWYRSESGRIPTNWPYLAASYARRARFNPADFESP